ncbi:MAG TPA: hypothetical protein DD979_00905 [Gammaproteobacteria bacterium]|jgi:catechol 2,3-dioxygenase-like lactoylglutathione lyase family enzyme|nr:hypothetical protein [Gammaproteobacteria bacterium]
MLLVRVLREVLSIAPIVREQSAMITGVKDVYYNVADMRAAVGFYTDVLGMRVVYESEYWTALSLGGLHIGLHWNEGESVPQVPYDSHGAHCGATLTLATDDIDIDTQHLLDRQVEVIGRLDEPWGRLTVFKDLDGNVLKLMQQPDH